MHTVTIYKDDDAIDHRTIELEFLIIETPSGELRWFEKDVSSPGVIKIWLQIREGNPLLCFVLPDWQVIIDGIWMEKKFYQDIEELEGKEVELRYGKYRFVFQL